MTPARPPAVPTATGAAGASSAAPPTFASLYEEHFERVWRTARRLGVPEDAAEDVVQDVFLVLHRRLHELDGTRPARPWILGITTRVVADHRRRYHRKDARVVSHDADSDGSLQVATALPAPSDAVEQRENVRLLEELLGTLDEAKRDVLVLSELEELTAAEIAELTGTNVNTISARLRAARKDFEAAYARHRARERARRSP